MHTRFRLPAPPRAVRPTRRRPIAALALGLAGALLLGGGITVLNPGGTPARAATSGSALTINWVGDTGPAKDYQPRRNTQNGHYGDFKNVAISVSQTQNLIDQTIRVEVSGMPGASKRAPAWSKLTAMNYVQAMQCWGDPNAENFRETCQWGGHVSTMNEELLPHWNHHRSPIPPGVPFRTVWGEEFANKQSPDSDRQIYQSLFTEQNSNEKLGVRMGKGGKAWFNFETQSSYAAPYLGCGLPKAANGAGERCWLVVVPRGEHQSFAGEPSDWCGLRRSVDTNVQIGSPLDPSCDYWDNRIVVPLDFQPTGDTCPPGAAERALAGTDLGTAAVSSWQPKLCATGGATYSFAALSDSVARGQLLTRQSRFVLTGRPLTESTVADDLFESLSDADIVYAPITVAAPVIGFVADEFYNGRVENMKLTPRLIAKFLTQSYGGTVPWIDGGVDTPDYMRGKDVFKLVYDPEFQAINPDWIAYAGEFQNGLEPGLLVVPTASDTNAQLWQWLQADDKARAFLSGEPDNVLPGDEGNRGITINPNYLPKGHPNATSQGLRESVDRNGHSVLTQDDSMPRRTLGLTRDDGAPYSLADTPLEIFPRADAWSVPLALGPRKQRLDTTQWNQPRGTLKEVAVDIARITRKIKADWSPNTSNGSGGLGDWVVKPNGYLSNFLIGLTGSANAAAYGLNAAELQLPNKPGVYASARTADMTAAVAAASGTEVAGVSVIHPAKVGVGAYPLTQIVWGAMRLDGSTPDERRDYAAFIEQVTTTGQNPGTSIGELPVGYAPLTEELRARAAEAVKKIRAYTDPTEAPPVDVPDGDTPTPPGDGAGLRPPARGPEGSNNIPVNPDDLGTSLISGGPNVTPGGTPDEAGLTETNAPSGFTGLFSALGGLLLLGASGAVAVPGLLRRRDTPLL